MKDFFIKIRHFKEASSISSESPMSLCLMELERGPEEPWALGKTRTKHTGVLAPSCRHGIPPLVREALSLMGHYPASDPLLPL